MFPFVAEPIVEGPGDQPALPDWVRSRQLPADTAAGIREALARDLMQASACSVGLYYNVATVDGELTYTDCDPFGPEERVAHLRACRGRPLSDFVDYSPSMLTRINAFCEQTPDEWPGNRMLETLWNPMGAVSVLGMSAVVGGELVGWIGSYRIEGEARHGEPLVAAMQPRADAYVHCLAVASSLDGSVAGDRAIVLLSADGDTRFASAEGERWMAEPAFADRLRERIRSGELAPFWASGAIVRVTRVEGDEGALLCAEIAPSEAWAMPPLARMSRQKRLVAELAAFGATAAEVGRTLEISPETVRAHLKQIYAELGVGSRVELAEHVRELMP
jgi:DNA-binding CsgD family transcriptional regulator